MSALEARAVSKQFGGVRALDAVSLRLQAASVKRTPKFQGIRRQ